MDIIKYDQDMISVLSQLLYLSWNCPKLFSPVSSRLISKESLDKKDLKLKIIYQELIDLLLNKEYHYRQEDQLFKLV